MAIFRFHSFFLLSGFILAYRYHNFDFLTGKLFYLKTRFLRLGSVYYLAMILAVSIIFLIELKGRGTSWGNHIFYSFTHLTMLQSLIPFKSLIQYWNIHSWSISVEMVLYTVSLFLIPFVSQLKWRGLVITWILTLMGNSMLYLVLNLKTHFAPAYILTFLNGIVLANIFRRYHDTLKAISGLLFWISGIFIMGLLMATLPKDFYSAFNPVFHIVFSCLILGSAYSTTSTKWLRTSWMVYLGDVSFGMYILQAPVKLGTQQFWSKILMQQEVSGHAYNLTLLVVVIGVSAVVHTFYDKPLQKKLRSIIQRKADGE